jgi:hypothetical protein
MVLVNTNANQSVGNVTDGRIYQNAQQKIHVRHGMNKDNQVFTVAASIDPTAIIHSSIQSLWLLSSSN